MNVNENAADHLLDAGARVDIVDDAGMTPLHWAAKLCCLRLARRCIEAGADVDQVETTYGTSALHEAVKNSQHDMIRLLMEAGATVNLTDRTGYSPLHWAVEYRKHEVVQLLLASGVVDVNIQDKEELEVEVDGFNDDSDGVSLKSTTALQVCTSLCYWSWLIQIIAATLRSSKILQH